MTSLHMARARYKGMKDDFNTLMDDVDAEISQYVWLFQGKIIHCNCDNLNSNFIKYFYENFRRWRLKKIIATWYSPSDLWHKRQGGIWSYDGRKVRQAKLVGDGSFASDECLAISRAADIVITNPPFSLFTEFARLLLRPPFKFLVVAPMTALGYSGIFNKLKSGYLRAGYNTISTFERDDGSEEKKNCVWLTNLAGGREPLVHGLARKSDKLANVDALDVGSIKDIPYDYKGLMAVPITFPLHHNPDQYELVGLCHFPRNMDGRCLFKRMLIRRVQR